MNNKELLEYFKRSHEYSLMEQQMGEQRIIDEITKNYEPRISSLEHCRSRITGVITGLTLAWATLAGALGFVYQHQDKIKGMKP